jgi:hypothetical protein
VVASPIFFHKKLALGTLFELFSLDQLLKFDIVVAFDRVDLVFFACLPFMELNSAAKAIRLLANGTRVLVAFF